MGTYNRWVKKTDFKFSTVCEKCQKTAGRGGGVIFLTHTVQA